MRTLRHRIQDRRRQTHSETWMGQIIETGRVPESEDGHDVIVETTRFIAMENIALWQTCERLAAEVDLLKGRVAALERKVGR